MTDTTSATVTVSLEYPITFKEKEITEITFRRRKAKDLIAMDSVKGENRKFMAMLASMADQPLPVIEALDGDDFDEVVEATVSLMGKSAQKMAASIRSQAETQ